MGIMERKSILIYLEIMKYLLNAARVNVKNIFILLRLK